MDLIIRLADAEKLERVKDVASYGYEADEKALVVMCAEGRKSYDYNQVLRTMEVHT